jgi:hypothetical protein
VAAIRSAPRRAARFERAGSADQSKAAALQLRSERGAGVTSVDDVSAAAAGATDVSVEGAVDVSVGAVLFSVAEGSVVVVLAGIAAVSAGVDWVVVVVVVSVDCATAAPMPASRAAAAATADNFF